MVVQSLSSCTSFDEKKTEYPSYTVEIWHKAWNGSLHIRIVSPWTLFQSKQTAESDDNVMCRSISSVVSLFTNVVYISGDG